MSNVIYCFKIWISPSKYEFQKKMECFAVCVYLKTWKFAPLSACAPYNGMFFLLSYYLHTPCTFRHSKSTSYTFANLLKWWLRQLFAKDSFGIVCDYWSFWEEGWDAKISLVRAAIDGSFPRVTLCNIASEW